MNKLISCKSQVTLLLFCLIMFTGVINSEAQRIPANEFSFDSEEIDLYEFSPSGQKLALVSFNKILVLDTLTKEIISTYRGHEVYDNSVTSITFLPDEKFATSGARATVKIWRVDDGTEVKSFNTASYGLPISYSVTALAFFPNGEKLVTSEGSFIQIWDINSGKELRRIITPYFSTKLAFLPDGIRLLDVSIHNARILSTATGEIIREYSGGSATLSSDGTKIFIGSNVTGYGNTSVIQQWDIANGTLLSSSKEFESQVTQADISKYGKRVLIVEKDAMNTRVVNLDTGSVVSEFASDGIRVFQQPRFSADGKKVYGISDETLNVWDISDITSRVPNSNVYEN